MWLQRCFRFEMKKCIKMIISIAQYTYVISYQWHIRQVEKQYFTMPNGKILRSITSLNFFFIAPCSAVVVIVIYPFAMPLFFFFYGHIIFSSSLFLSFSLSPYSHRFYDIVDYVRCDDVAAHIIIVLWLRGTHTPNCHRLSHCDRIPRCRLHFVIVHDSELCCVSLRLSFDDVGYHFQTDKHAHTSQFYCMHHVHMDITIIIIKEYNDRQAETDTRTD